MPLIELFIIALGLSMDAFAIAVCKGLAMRTVRLRAGIIVGLYFGVAQAVMPLLGYLLASRFATYIEALDHWAAFVLLGAIGCKMLYDGLKSGGEDCEQTDELSFGAMFRLAVATSIDALAVGISFAFLNISILPAVSLIGATTFALTAVGVWLGVKFGARLSGKAETIGGIILILIGLKILIEHLTN